MTQFYGIFELLRGYRRRESGWARYQEDPVSSCRCTRRFQTAGWRPWSRRLKAPAVYSVSPRLTFRATGSRQLGGRCLNRRFSQMGRRYAIELYDGPFMTTSKGGVRVAGRHLGANATAPPAASAPPPRCVPSPGAKSGRRRGRALGNVIDLQRRPPGPSLSDGPDRTPEQLWRRRRIAADRSPCPSRRTRRSLRR